MNNKILAGAILGVATLWSAAVQAEVKLELDGQEISDLSSIQYSPSLLIMSIDHSIGLDCSGGGGSTSGLVLRILESGNNSHFIPVDELLIQNLGADTVLKVTSADGDAVCTVTDEIFIDGFES